MSKPEDGRHVRFDAIEWNERSFVLGGQTFWLQHDREGATADDGFVFYKSRGQVDELERLFTELRLRPATVLELGIWDGGSAAFWTELLAPVRYSAIDLQTRGDSAYFSAWLGDPDTGHGMTTHTHWGVSQTDAAALAAVIEQDGLDSLDLVIDDCSHQLLETRTSFELLFPRVGPGGWYLIEDWAWALQEPFLSKDAQWSTLPSLHPLVLDLIKLHGSRPDVIPSIRILPDVVAVERGPAELEGFTIQSATRRRERPWWLIAYRRARRAVGAVRRHLLRRDDG